MKLSINVARVIAELEHLATISECTEPPPAVTRIVFSETDLRARDYLDSLYQSAALSIRVDAVGNTFVRWEGTRPELSVVGTGSHTDAIPHAGMYDGTVGVLGGLEAIRSLKEAGFEPERSIELLMITSEEPTRFGIGCLGSRVIAGQLDEAALDRLVDSEGDGVNKVRRRAGFGGEVAEAVLGKDYYHAWIELHIEQGPELESRGLPVGIVTAIAAPATLSVTIEGVGGHAGGVLMPKRRDALCAAAELISVIERVAIDSPSDDLVATVGQLAVHPGAVNSIPSRVTFSIDIRDVHQASRDDAIDQIVKAMQEISTRRSVTISHQQLNADPPAIADPFILETIEQACRDSGLAYQRMVSRAYHDSLFMARISPMSMIFIPCRNGVSHRPDEYSSPEQIEQGIEVLARTLALLSRGHGGSAPRRLEPAYKKGLRT